MASKSAKASKRRGRKPKVARVVPEEKQLLDASEVAQIIGFSRWMVYRFARERRIPSIRVGNSVRFRRESIERWLDDLEIDAREPEVKGA